jgi:hypothetical protein
MSDALSNEKDLATAARALAILALQTNEYHRGCRDFRDAVDDVLLITRPVAEKACDEILTALEQNRG